MEESSSNTLLLDLGLGGGAFVFRGDVFLSDFKPPDDAIMAAIGFDDGRAGASVCFKDPIPPEEVIAAAIGWADGRD